MTNRLYGGIFILVEGSILKLLDLQAYTMVHLCQCSNINSRFNLVHPALKVYYTFNLALIQFHYVQLQP